VKIIGVAEKMEIKKQFCTVVQVEDIEDAERVALYWNGFKFSQSHVMNATVHPFSYRKRPVTKMSRHALFAPIYNPELAK